MAWLGIDIGSIGLAMVLLSDKAEVLHKYYKRHQGEALSALQTALAAIDQDSVKGLALTGSGTMNLTIGGIHVDPIVAGAEGVKKAFPGVKNIIYIGGGSFSLTQLDDNGKYVRSRSNSACASGTGAFLDQQATRLQIPPTELAQKAMSYTGHPPSVATRCAVFAKSDMIHLQQEGFSVEAIAAGLCAGLGHSTVDGLLGGRSIEGKTAIIGGVAKNTVVINAVKDKLGTDVVVPAEPELVNAFGAAYIALQKKGEGGVDLFGLHPEDDHKKRSYLRSPLELKLSDYPDFVTAEHWVNEDNSEIAIVNPSSGRIQVSLGIDIGSTSTKAAVMNNDNIVIGWIYRKTAGDPIKAVQLLFKAFREMEKKGGFSLNIKGVGTTGSGRKMIGELIGADLATNEITAHATAACFIDPEVDTILELGGQDAKFTQLQNGMVYNSIMNYVCAAGTGSFIEEQALKLDISLTEYADKVMGLECPKTSDRCTVYMERDLDILLARGWSKEQVAAAVLHSVRDNYLNKVVGGLHIGDHIYFQGATARNKGLIAAFEVELGKPIQVSPFCHVTGALGMCILAKDRIAEEDKSARFEGFEFADKKISVTYEVCQLCHNKCNLSIIKTGNKSLAWGLKCGRDYEDNKVKVKKVTTYDWWQKREKIWASPAPLKRDGGFKIGIPRSLGTYGYYPFWQAFFAALGCVARLSPRSSEEILHKGIEISQAEYCAPVAMSHGHVRALLDDPNLDYIFVPHMIREPIPEGFSDAHFCCYVQSHPSVLSLANGLNLGKKLLSPLMQFNLSEKTQVEQLAEALSGPLCVGTRDIRKALRKAKKHFAAFNAECLRIGDDALRTIEEQNTMGIVCIGRPYNTCDAGMTLDLPKKIAEMGYPVLYMDQLASDMSAILPDYNNMYWHYGQKILATASYIAQSKRLFGIYFTNFMCGPDSYIMTYFKEIMGKTGKPYLCLQFDGHGADAGYLTRIEAALESFHLYSDIARPE